MPDKPPPFRFGMTEEARRALHDYFVLDKPLSPDALAIDFDDLTRQLKAHGLIPGDPAAQADPITPDEAAEELDDREAAELADELAARDAAETKADGEPGGSRTWSELDAATEADRRFDLDTVWQVAQIVALHSKPLDSESSGDTTWKLCRAPQGFEDEVGEFLRGVMRLGVQAIGRLNDQ